MEKSEYRTSLLKSVKQSNKGREIQVPDDLKWGELILPALNERKPHQEKALNVLAICSWTLGFLTFETLKLIERRLPGKINIVGLVTDDPADVRAKISKKRRFWRYYEPGQQEEFELGIIEAALTFGVPCYTGDVKSSYFRKLLKELNPDIILVSAFGQLIDKPIISYPRYGIYNMHPADLLHHYGAGPQPWEDLVDRRAETTRVTLHRVSEEIDSGDIVGQSPSINVRLKGGGFTDDVRLIGEKTLLPVDHMVAELICTIIRRNHDNIEGTIDRINFEEYFQQDFKDKLMKPIDPSNKGKILPLPSEEIRFTV